MMLKRFVYLARVNRDSFCKCVHGLIWNCHSLALLYRMLLYCFVSKKKGEDIHGS